MSTRVLRLIAILHAVFLAGCSGGVPTPSPSGEGVEFSPGDSVLYEPDDFPEYLDAHFYINRYSGNRNEVAIDALRAVRSQHDIFGTRRPYLCVSVMALADAGRKDGSAYKFGFVVERKLVAAFLDGDPEELVENLYWVDDPIAIDPETGILVNQALRRHFKEKTGSEPNEPSLPRVESP